MATPRPRFPFPNNSQDASYPILLDWWTALEADKGERAELKRAEHPLRVAFNPAYHDLLHRLQEAGYRLGIDSRERLAVLAGLAAHVKQHADNGTRSPLRWAAQNPEGIKPQVSELRFRTNLSNRRS